MIQRRAIKDFTRLNRGSFAAATIVAAIAIAAPATAQQRYMGVGNNVTVDLGAIGSGGSRNLPLGSEGQVISNTTGEIVLFPPSTRPVSRLEGPLANRSFALTPPSRATTTAPRLTPPKAPAPAKASTPAAAPPKPVTPAPAAPAPQTASVTPPTPATPPATPTVAAPPPPPSPAQTPVQSAAVTPPPPPAAAPATNASLPANETRILFSPDSADLTDSAKAALDNLANSLNENDALRIQLQAFAGGNDESAPEARRLSLKRALNVRSHLVDRDVRNTRMDVRALGIKSGNGPADRVDAVIVQR